MIEVVGIGLDGAAGLTTKVRQLVEGANLLVGSKRHLSYFRTRSERLVLGDLQQAMDTIGRRMDEKVVVLVSGDPLFFGWGRLLLKQLPEDKLRFHPHLSSVQLAFNRVKVPWQDAEVVSLHGRGMDVLTPLLLQGASKIAMLTDTTYTPGMIALHCAALDLPTPYDFWVCENLGGKTERVSRFSGEEIEELLDQEFSALNILIVLQQEKAQKLDLNRLPLLGLPDRLFLSFEDRPGLMTKREVRLQVLGDLALQEDQVVWDVGAGTGSVSIEIARLCPGSRVHAIEKTAMGINLIQENARRFQISNVVAVRGTAPGILSTLPPPERIFIGGSGGNMEDIIPSCAVKLLPGGVMVLALATVEHLYTSLSWFKNRGWHYRISQVNVSRSVPVADLTRFTPLNPVTILTVTKS